jgi:hypothetical protein
VRFLPLIGAEGWPSRHRGPWRRGERAKSTTIDAVAGACEPFTDLDTVEPDAAPIDHYVRHAEYAPSEWTAFARFPTWMWRNREVADFVDWLRTRVRFHDGRRSSHDARVARSVCRTRIQFGV